MTARMSHHARVRCGEMGVSTKIAKRMVEDHDVAWTNADGLTVATSDRHPEVTVVFADGAPPTVVTVVWRTQETYDRATYRPT